MIPNPNAQTKKQSHFGAARTVEQAHGAAQEYITKQLSADGWWSYKAGHGPSTEATAWCAIAVRKSASGQQALNSLTAAQNEDGGWSTAPQVGHSDWTSGPALLALRLVCAASGAQAERKSRRAIERALAYMFDSRTEFYGSLARLLLLAVKGKEGLQYARGWPWTVDCFHWIEPTSYALLALKCPKLPDKEVYSEIIERANQFMIEHECKGGGWNHGSNLCLGFYLPPYIVTTAEALLAMQELSSAQPVQSGLKFLQEHEVSERTALEHAWSILALNVYDKAHAKMVNGLIARQNADGSFGNNLMTSALSALALESDLGDHILKYK